MCLCGRDTCNGPSLPPKDFLEDESNIIDIDEVVREMNEVKEARPAPVAASALTTLPSVICLAGALLRTLHSVYCSTVSNCWVLT